MKICSKCELSKSIEDFNKDKSRKDGLFPQCKVCKYSGSKIFYENNKEVILSKQQVYYLHNREAILDRINISSDTPEKKAEKKEYDRLYNLNNIDKKRM